MALIECYECKGKFSSEAKACPHCGLPIEVEIEYHDNGQISKLVFLKDGEPHGLTTKWYENGQKEGEINYKEGKADGLLTVWYENGQKKAEGNCKGGDGLPSCGYWTFWYGDGWPDGDWTYWYEDGQTEREINYKDGKIVEMDGEPPEPRYYSDD